MVWLRFTPITEKDREEMLKQIGVESVSCLFADIPKEKLVEGEMGLPKALNEMQLRKELESIASKNKSAKQLGLFLGGGRYRHFIPATVPAITGRSEFCTAYTPYQSEASQGLLQAIFEWQTYICMLTGMDVANASVYDGASGTAEAMAMARKATGREKVLFEKSLDPRYRAVLETYARATNTTLEETSLDEAESGVDRETACLIVQRPDFFGRVQNLEKAGRAAHGNGALLIVTVSEAMSLPWLGKISGEKADIVAIDVQSFGNSLSFGGPTAGVIACRQEFLRLLPGRIAGKTTDSQGREGFVLTLQAREQHIRRERAGSNICSNQALCALASTVYLATVGKRGLAKIAEENHANAKMLAERLEGLGFELPFGKGFFNEFVAKKENAKEIQERLLEKGIVFGYPLEKDFPEMKDCILVAATEMNGREQIESLLKELEALP